MDELLKELILAHTANPADRGLTLIMCDRMEECELFPNIQKLIRSDVTLIEERLKYLEKGGQRPSVWLWSWNSGEYDKFIRHRDHRESELYTNLPEWSSYFLPEERSKVGVSRYDSKLSVKSVRKVLERLEI